MSSVSSPDGSSEDAAPDPTFEALQKRVVDDWDDDERHAKLVSYAQQSRKLGELAAFYKHASIAEGSPYRLKSEQLEDAKKRLGGVAMLAMMDLDASKSVSETPPGLQAIRIAAALFLISTVALLFWLLTKR